MQVPIGLEEEFEGLVDLLELKAYNFHGAIWCTDIPIFLKYKYLRKILDCCHVFLTITVRELTADIQQNLEAPVTEKRCELIEVVS
ncbi:hypothetical protein BHE74_00032258 [Ensete ventricosum]|uniref:Uncharacterized protein n=1 Tax=Ensete ventricosum TaxID=4639 RepID=A0A444C0L2_ENSVE|nr:hypothetical protein B296_00058547 [Ensete ventricosum]RWV79449.1 hypothetical protein GW17_00059419 [Ensete ventricosum]RWW60726.1 hypothetical protein BHE74_00032258 [Ensete ventricosum]RZR75460.1 hypothetical protein BHM03_00058378 [Ensete ventricosum]